MWALLRKFKDAIKNRDLASIIAVAEQLADLLSISREVKELVELIASVQAGDWSGILRNAGEFLIVISEHFAAQYGIGFVFAADADLEAQIEVMLDAMESGTLPVMATSDDPEKKNIVPALLILLQLFRLFREWRNR